MAMDSSKECVGVVLAAGAGRRLGPMGDVLPKALCPVGGRALVDLALDRIRPAVSSAAVNVHHGRDVMLAHLRAAAPDVHVSIEEPRPLGTAGAIARLAPWIDGRGVVVVNADAWIHGDVDPSAGWDGERVRVVVHGDDPFGPTSRIVASVLPWSIVAGLSVEPSGLYEVVWRDAAARGEIDVVHFDGEFIDCGRPADLLAANRRAVEHHGGSIIAADAVIGPSAVIERSVIGAGARIDGVVIDSVVWPGQSVSAGERLVSSTRVGSGLDVSD